MFWPGSLSSTSRAHSLQFLQKEEDTGPEHAEKDVFFAGGLSRRAGKAVTVHQFPLHDESGHTNPPGLSRKVPSGVAHLQAHGAPSPRKSGPGPARMCAREGRGPAEARVRAGFPRNPWGGGWLPLEPWAASCDPAGAACPQLGTSSAVVRVRRGACGRGAGKHVPLHPRGKTASGSRSQGSFRDPSKPGCNQPRGAMAARGPRLSRDSTVHVVSFLVPGASSVGERATVALEALALVGRSLLDLALRARASLSGLSLTACVNGGVCHVQLWLVMEALGAALSDNASSCKRGECRHTFSQDFVGLRISFSFLEIWTHPYFDCNVFNLETHNAV